MGTMSDSPNTAPAVIVFDPAPSIDAVTFARFMEKEEKRFQDCLARLARNGVEDKEGAAELVAIANRHDALATIHRGYLR